MLIRNKSCALLPQRSRIVILEREFDGLHEQ